LENNIGIAQHFLSSSLSNHLKENLQKLFSNDAMLLAGTGNIELVTKDVLFRKDKIYWLDKLHNDPHENAFFALIDVFVAYLNSTCYTGINSYEFHYTMYDEGSFYKKHLDQFRNNDNRKFSIIFYLNANWQQEDGGELCIHLPNSLLHISPNDGKCVFFKSNELEHEVLVTHKPRMSITGWLKTNAPLI
jgi:SM-20-related protein